MANVLNISGYWLNKRPVVKIDDGSGPRDLVVAPGLRELLEGERFYAWGPGAGETAALAVAVLGAVCPPPIVKRWYRQFACTVVAKFSRDEWHLDGRFIEAWLNVQEARAVTALYIAPAAAPAGAREQTSLLT
jgi:hypothetical protein